MNITDDANDSKRRGRPKKLTDNLEKIDNDPASRVEEIILHLPIKYTPSLNQDKSSSLSKQDKFNTLSGQSPVKKKDKKDIKEEKDEDMFVVDKISTYMEPNEEEPSENHLMLLEEIKKKDMLIAKLKKDIEYLQENQVKVTGKKENKFVKLDIKLINDNHITDKTNISCWWCGYNFDNMPFFIPDKLYNGTYYVFGCFCNASCAAAYNIYDLNDYKTTDRHSLISQLFLEYGGSGPVEIAPQRERFERLGGDINISTYRNNILTKKDSKLLLPPMTPIIPYIEEKTIEYNAKKSNKIIRNSHIKQYLD